jgi:hypothetical protein
VSRPPVYPRRGGGKVTLRVREHRTVGGERPWAVVRERGRGQSDEVVARFRTREDAVAALPHLRAG